MHGAMKIVHAASELFPYAKTGGLADAVGSLTATLAGAGHEVMAFLPGYRAVLEHPDAAQAQRCLRLKIEMGDQFISGDVRRFSPRPNLTIYLICRDEWFDRRGLYGDGERDYEDNFHRFLFFQKSVIETMRLLALGADILHCHDWQTGLLPLLLRDAEKRFGLTLAVTTVFTIHNIAFQGLFPMRSYHRLNLPDEFRGIDGVEFYGQINMMKGGLLFADRVTTVSPQYAREIQTAEFGCGLEGVVTTRAADLTGILNGVDYAQWDPRTDSLLAARYSADNLLAKRTCKADLLDTCSLSRENLERPLIGIVSRFAGQKGFELIEEIASELLAEDLSLVALGTGDPRTERFFTGLAEAQPDRIAVRIGYDNALAHKIEAGADIFLMPSLYEPSGLNQMYSLRYGTVPVVRATGGLDDTVDDETGFKFQEYSGAALLAALRAALAAYKQPFLWTEIMRAGMRKDYSWQASASEYSALYRRLAG